MPSAWIEHIKDFAKRKGITYGCALSDPKCSEEYKAKRPLKLNTEEQKENEQMGAQDTNVAKKATISEEQKKYDIVKKILMELSRREGEYGNDRDPFGFVKDFLIIPEREGKTKKEIVDKAYKYFKTYPAIKYDILHSVPMEKLFLELQELMENEQMGAEDKYAPKNKSKYVESDLYSRHTTEGELKDKITRCEKEIERINHTQENVSKGFFLARYKSDIEYRKRLKRDIIILKDRLKILSSGEDKKDNITMTITEKKKRGRKPKYETEEERKKAKREQTLASNNKKREEKKAEGKGLAIMNKVEDANGLAHIYELTPAHIIRMTKDYI
jgi:hypothetical protein